MRNLLLIGLFLVCEASFGKCPDLDHPVDLKDAAPVFELSKDKKLVFGRKLFPSVILHKVEFNEDVKVPEEVHDRKNGDYVLSIAPLRSAIHDASWYSKERLAYQIKVSDTAGYLGMPHTVWINDAEKFLETTILENKPQEFHLTASMKQSPNKKSASSVSLVVKDNQITNIELRYEVLTKKVVDQKIGYEGTGKFQSLCVKSYSGADIQSIKAEN